MLRESSNLGAINVNLAEVTQAGGMSNDNDIEAAELLSQFAESLVHRDLDESARLRSEIISELGKEAFVDVASTAAAFHGFVRVADSTGIPTAPRLVARIARNSNERSVSISFMPRSSETGDNVLTFAVG